MILENCFATGGHKQAKDIVQHVSSHAKVKIELARFAFARALPCNRRHIIFGTPGTWRSKTGPRSSACFAKYSREHRRRSIDESSIETIPNVYWNRSKEGEREREREGGGCFRLDRIRSKFRWWYIICSLVTLYGSLPSGCSLPCSSPAKF